MVSVMCWPYEARGWGKYPSSLKPKKRRLLSPDWWPGADPILPAAAQSFVQTLYLNIPFKVISLKNVLSQQEERPANEVRYARRCLKIFLGSLTLSFGLEEIRYNMLSTSTT